MIIFGVEDQLRFMLGFGLKFGLEFGLLELRLRFGLVLSLGNKFWLSLTLAGSKIEKKFLSAKPTGIF